MKQKTILKVSVRNLVEFTLMTGDLVSVFSGSSRLIEGVKAHQAVQKAEDDTYAPEVTISYLVENGDITLEINGRIDGIISDGNGITVDEIKSTAQELININHDYNLLHWAQAKCYAFIYANENKLCSINVRLTYYNLETKEIKRFLEVYTISELEVFFNDIIDRYLYWARIIIDWNFIRDFSIKRLEFPYLNYRKGQRELAAAVYRTIRDGEKLFVQAPTGIGKTLATIFPSIKAIGEGHTSKIFYLTAKTITRTIAENAIDKLRDKGLRIKTLTLTAKEKVCFNSGTPCDPKKCEFAKGYYDRVKPAIEELYKLDSFSRAVIEEYAQKYKICPFEFSLDMSLWADCIICDYNYVFDPRVNLKRFFSEGGGDYTFLVDEAHNLVDRAREMFSAELFKKPVLELKREFKEVEPEISKSLNKINSCLVKYLKCCEMEEVNYVVNKTSPKELIPLLKKFMKAAEKWLAENENSQSHEKLLDFYFNTSSFIRTSEYFDSRYVSYFEKSDEDFKVKLFCLDPSYLLYDAMQRGNSAILFSATLIPLKYFKKILGGEDANELRLTSPFQKENLCLLVEVRISTKYKVRELSYDRIAKSIISLVSGKEGNYFAYFPSYKYMNEVLYRIISQNTGIRIISQRPGMSDVEKEAFLEEFNKVGEQTLIGFAVMGGMFGEGIDLTGERLSGAVIVGVGLPQICLEREIICGYFQENFDMGFEYAYIYPGMNKVMQAAGRVIRTEKDTGVVLLIDERFNHTSYRELFPAEWEHAVSINSRRTLEKQLEEFWDIQKI